jgi:hypothetical protein
MAGKIAGRIAVLVLAAVLGGLISNRIGVKAQSGLVGGGYRVTLNLPSGTLPSGTLSSVQPFPAGALLTSEGGIVANVAQLPCLNAGESIGTVVGTWGMFVSQGLKVQFQMVGPVYAGGVNQGELGIVGSFPMIGIQGSGTAMLTVPKGIGCDSLNGAQISFSAARIPPVPPNPTD